MLAIDGGGKVVEVNFDINKNSEYNAQTGNYRMTLEMIGSYDLENTDYQADIVLVIDYSG